MGDLSKPSTLRGIGGLGGESLHRPLPRRNDNTPGVQGNRDKMPALLLQLVNVSWDG